MRSSSSLLGRVLFWIAYGSKSKLESLEGIFNENPCTLCVPWIFWGLLRKKSLGEIFNKIWPMARNQSSSEFIRILDGNKIFNKNP